jgi:hypothetical protein
MDTETETWKPSRWELAGEIFAGGMFLALFYVLIVITPF